MLVYNKIDQFDDVIPHIEFNDENQPVAVYLSAQSGKGIELLFDAIRLKLKNDILSLALTLSPQLGQIRHAFYQLNCIKQEKIGDTGEFELQLKIDKIEWLKLVKKFPLLEDFSPTKDEDI